MIENDLKVLVESSSESRKPPRDEYIKQGRLRPGTIRSLRCRLYGLNQAATLWTFYASRAP